MKLLSKFSYNFINVGLFMSSDHLKHITSPIF